MYDDYEEVGLHPGLYMMQLLLMVIPPAATLLIALFIEDSQLACVVAAVASFFAVGLLQTISYIMHMQDTSNDKKTDPVLVDLSDGSDSFCSKASFYFLISPRQSLVELLTVIVLAPVYAGLMTYMMHPTTVGEDGLSLQLMTCVIIFFSAYSLISLPIPESTPYQTNDSFSLFSHHY